MYDGNIPLNKGYTIIYGREVILSYTIERGSGEILLRM
jgi:hypothetical protein